MADSTRQNGGASTPRRAKPGAPQPAAGSTGVRRALGKILPPVLLVIGVIGFITAFVLTNTDPATSPIVATNPNIEALIPQPNSEVLRQSQVGIDLTSGFEAELIINGVQIPPDEVNVLRDVENPERSSDQAGGFDTTLNRFLYQPLEGRSVPELKGDENCAIASFWPLSDPTNIQTIEWCFTVA